MGEYLKINNVSKCHLKNSTEHELRWKEMNIQSKDTSNMTLGVDTMRRRCKCGDTSKVSYGNPHEHTIVTIYCPSCGYRVFAYTEWRAVEMWNHPRPEILRDYYGTNNKKNEKAIHQRFC